MARKVILFDWDGTLVDTFELWIRVFQSALKTLDITVSRQDILSQLHQETMHTALGVTTAQEDDFFTAFKQAMEQLHKAQLYDGAKETLEQLVSDGYTIGVVTNASIAACGQTMINTGVLSLFNTIVTRDEVTNKKPHREPIDKAVRKLNCGLDDVVFVGESIADIGSAESAGVPMLQFTSPMIKPYHDYDALVAETYPVAKFSHWKDFRNALAKV